jgi:hypothetical protein
MGATDTLRGSILHSFCARSIDEHDKTCIKRQTGSRKRPRYATSIALLHLRACVHGRACDGGVEAAAALPGAREQDSSLVMRPNTLATTQPRQLI